MQQICWIVSINEPVKCIRILLSLMAMPTISAYTSLKTKTKTSLYGENMRYADMQNM